MYQSGNIFLFLVSTVFEICNLDIWPKIANLILEVFHGPSGLLYKILQPKLFLLMGTFPEEAFELFFQLFQKYYFFIDINWRGLKTLIVGIRSIKKLCRQ